MNIIFLLTRGHTKDYNYVFDVRYLLSKTYLRAKQTDFELSKLLTVIIIYLMNDISRSLFSNSVKQFQNS